MGNQNLSPEVILGVCIPVRGLLRPALGHPGRAQTGEEATELMWHTFWPIIYSLFCKGQILSKSYNMHKTTNCFVVMAISPPFPPRLSVWHGEFGGCLVSFVLKWLSLHSYLHLLLPFPRRQTLELAVLLINAMTLSPPPEVCPGRT